MVLVCWAATPYNCWWFAQGSPPETVKRAGHGVCTCEEGSSSCLHSGSHQNWLQFWLTLSTLFASQHAVCAKVGPQTRLLRAAARGSRCRSSRPARACTMAAFKRVHTHPTPHAEQDAALPSGVPPPAAAGGARAHSRAGHACRGGPCCGGGQPHSHHALVRGWWGGVAAVAVGGALLPRRGLARCAVRMQGRLSDFPSLPPSLK